MNWSSACASVIVKTFLFGYSSGYFGSELLLVVFESLHFPPSTAYARGVISALLMPLVPPRLLVPFFFWCQCSVRCCHSGHHSESTSAASGVTWVSYSPTCYPWALHRVGYCCPLHRLFCCSWLIWGCWKHHCQGCWVHCCCWGPRFLYAAPTTGRTGVGGAATRGWVTSSAVPPEASGHKCHLPLLGEGQGLSHRCCCCACSLWSSLPVHFLKPQVTGTTATARSSCVLDAVFTAGRTSVRVATARGGRGDCSPGFTASWRSSPPTFKCLDAWISQAFWCAVRRILCWSMDVLLFAT